jgi:hypothetical protein
LQFLPTFVGVKTKARQLHLSTPEFGGPIQEVIFFLCLPVVFEKQASPPRDPNKLNVTIQLWIALTNHIIVCLAMKTPQMFLTHQCNRIEETVHVKSDITTQCLNKRSLLIYVVSQTHEP